MAKNNGHSKPKQHRKPGKTVRKRHASTSAPNGSVAMPAKGPGRRRIVPVNSLDGISSQLAMELAMELVGRVRGIAERMIRESLANMAIRIK